jgi:hypothetical protein
VFSPIVFLVIDGMAHCLSFLQSADIKPSPKTVFPVSPRNWHSSTFIGQSTEKEPEVFQTCVPVFGKETCGNWGHPLSLLCEWPDSLLQEVLL